MDPKTRMTIVYIAINFLLSWTVLPFIIPPFRAYSLSELVEVLLWEGMGTVGWPLALLGIFAGLFLKHELTNQVRFLFILIYPGMLFLLVRVLSSRCRKRWELILLHLLLTLSFGAVWYKVLNGYVFMGG